MLLNTFSSFPKLCLFFIYKVKEPTSFLLPIFTDHHKMSPFFYRPLFRTDIMAAIQATWKQQKKLQELLAIPDPGQTVRRTFAPILVQKIVKCPNVYKMKNKWRK